MVGLFSSRRPEIAIDFGTANLRVVGRDDGILFDEPSLCCFSGTDAEPGLMAAGASAAQMVDRTPRKLDVRRPLRRGVLQDIETATELLRYAMPRALGRKGWRTGKALIGVPADATQAERSALLTAARDAGLGQARLVPEPFAAAIGAGLPVDNPKGTMIVECGAGTTEVALISLGGICLTHSARVGGASLDQAIADHLHFRHKFLIGALSARQIKHHHAAIWRADAPSDHQLEARGRNLATGMPGRISIPAREIDRVVEKHSQQIVDIVRDVLNETPPELSHDIHELGIVLTGGGAMTPLLPAMIAQDSGLPVVVAEDPIQCVARGLHKLLLN